MVKKYRKKPVEVEVFHWKRDPSQVYPQWVLEAHEKGNLISYIKNGELALSIKTLEGTMTANEGDYIIKGVQGEIYPCKPDIFEATYEEVDSKSRI